jgi:hypothetical protein
MPDKHENPITTTPHEEISTWVGKNVVPDIHKKNQLLLIRSMFRTSEEYSPCASCRQEKKYSL